MRKVLVISNTTGSAGMNCLMGIFAQINETGYDWDVRLVQSKGAIPHSFLADAVKDGADGVIASIGVASELTNALASLDIPIVTIHTDIAGGKSRRLVRLRNDDYAVGVCAAKFFLDHGSFRAYGFVPTVDPTPWSANRVRGFREQLATAGADVLVATRDLDLSNFLRDLPKPAAVLGATDLEASNVLATCRNLSLDVPGQVAVLGTDDNEIFCNSMRPSLSSVHTDDHGLGRRAARELQKMLRNRRGSDAESVILVPPTGVTERTSTRTVPPAGFLIRRALDYIRTNYQSGIDVGDVVRHLGVSPSLARTRFRQVLGKSIRDVIIETRLERVRKLLRTTSEPISRIAKLSGFTSACRLAHLFHAREGRSMNDYRRLTADSQTRT